MCYLKISMIIVGFSYPVSIDNHYQNNYKFVPIMCQ